MEKKRLKMFVKNTNHKQKKIMYGYFPEDLSINHRK
jgi:hypothetical protein